MTSALALVKLGGSIVTDKDALDDGLVATERVRRIGAELAAWTGRLVVVHGTGAVGKPAAIEHGFAATGRVTRDDRRIALHVRNDLHDLTRRVVRALLDAGLDAVSCDAAELLPLEPPPVTDGVRRVRAMLDQGLTPVFRGDMLRDDDAGYRVVSSDEIMALLAETLRPDLALFSTDVDGVLGDDGRVMAELSPASAAEMTTYENDERDVSRGMTGKVRWAIQTARFSERCVIGNGLVPGRVESLLRSDDAVHTRVRSDDSPRPRPA